MLSLNKKWKRKIEMVSWNRKILFLSPTEMKLWVKQDCIRGSFSVTRKLCFPKGENVLDVFLLDSFDVFIIDSVQLV
jgi:hypothetical protein